MWAKQIAGSFNWAKSMEALTFLSSCIKEKDRYTYIRNTILSSMACIRMCTVRKKTSTSLALPSKYLHGAFHGGGERSQMTKYEYSVTWMRPLGGPTYVTMHIFFFILLLQTSPPPPQVSSAQRRCWAVTWGRSGPGGRHAPPSTESGQEYNEKAERCPELCPLLCNLMLSCSESGFSKYVSSKSIRSNE